MNPVPVELIERKKMIAGLLVHLETNQPGSIRVHTNSAQIPTAIKLLAEQGHKKPFFASAQQFVIDCFLTYPEACDLLLTYCLLEAPDARRRRHVWNGYGVYKKCFDMLPRFQGHEPAFFIVALEPVFELFVGMLEPNRTILEENRQRGPELLAALQAKLRAEIPLMAHWLEAAASCEILGDHLVVYFREDAKFPLDSLSHPAPTNYLQEFLSPLAPLTLSFRASPN